MNEYITYQLLKIIKHNGNIWDLIDDGYEFGQVTYFINCLKKLNYIHTNQNGITTITGDGQDYIVNFETSNKITKYSKWILPRKEMWHKPVPQSCIYIPKG